MKLPLVWLALGFVLGLYISPRWDGPPLAVGLLLVACVAAHLLAREHSQDLGLPLLLVMGALLGLARGGPDVLTPAGGLVRFHGQEVVVQAVVASLPEMAGASTRVRLDVTAVDGEPDSGVAIAWVQHVLEPWPGREHPFLAYGDAVLVRGTLEAPSSDSAFDYREHLASQGIGSVLYRGVVLEMTPYRGVSPMAMVHRWRARMAAAVAAALPEPQASLTQALVLGVRGGLDPGVAGQFRRAGLAHVLAVSGMHVGILLAMAVGAFTALFGRRRGLYVIGPLAVLWGYVLVAGAPPSAVRASLMGSAYLLALATGRRGTPLNALAIAALVLTALDPPMLWNRSFQLSFTAMAGVLLVGLPLWTLTQGLIPYGSAWQGARPEDSPGGLKMLAAPMRQAARWAVGGVGISLGAVLGSLPLVALNFGEVPTLGMIATLAVMPVLPFMLVGGMLTAGLGALATPLSGLAVWVPAILGAYIRAVAAVFANLPGAVWTTTGVDAWMPWAYYAVAAAFLAALAWRAWLPSLCGMALAAAHGPRTAGGAAGVLGVAALAAAVPWLAVDARTDGNLHVYFLDVGQGDATLFRTPTGIDVLIDGGPDPRVTLARLDDHLPLFDRNVEAVFMTHPDADHLTGVMALARRGRVEHLLIPPKTPDEDDVWRRELVALGTASIEVTSGAIVRTPDGVTFEVLHPPVPLLVGTGADSNNNGLVVRVTYGASTLLLPADVERAGEVVLLDQARLGSADVLKLGHHGSDTSSSEGFLAAVRPDIGIVSAGRDNRFGHPSPEALERVGRYLPDERLFNTIVHGTVELTTDGERWWVQTDR